MQNNSSATNQTNLRFQIVSKLLIPQITLLTISILWMVIFPNDCIIEYFNLNLQILLAGLGAGITLAFAGYGFYFFAKKTKLFYEAVELFEQNLSPIIKRLGFFDIILLSCVSGSVEEIFFRGLIFKKVGIIISSIAFGLLHLPKPRFWIYALWATGSGAILALLFFWSGSIWTSIIAHITNNLIGMVLLKNLKQN